VTTYEAPAKLNFSLLVSPPRSSDGYHPLASLVQTIEWCDRLEAEPGEGRDELDSEIPDNLVEKALRVLREDATIPALRLTLHKEIPVAAGMGGGSSDAAAALLAGADAGHVDRSSLSVSASRVGADVPFFLTGGSVLMTGTGDRIEEVPVIEGFAVAVVVPEFGLSTTDVYRKWDDLEGPEGDTVPDDLLPPSLRGRMPIRNDLLPAALSLEPTFGDFMADVASVWGTTVCLTGSGSACFGFFATPDEAVDAASAVSHLVREGRGVEMRRDGVKRVHEPR
jgi:4-diphosphocytidyl-2-C-methyl-D-erythritol kinase